MVGRIDRWYRVCQMVAFFSLFLYDHPVFADHWPMERVGVKPCHRVPLMVPFTTHACCGTVRRIHYHRTKSLLLYGAA